MTRRDARDVELEEHFVEPGDFVSSLLSLSSPCDEWPELDRAAFYGLAGSIVDEIAPHTEADPALLLLTLLTMAGSAIGSGPHATAGNAQHPARLFVVCAGETAKARKGTSWAAVEGVMLVADQHFAETRVLGGWGSGEAVVDAVRDASDDAPGALDKRLLVQEGEFARFLKVCNRDGSTLSMTIRDAWDGKKLQARSRAATSQSTGHHISIVGHITLEELRMRLTDVEAANGFANRFLYVLGRRSQRLPEGGNVPQEVCERLGKILGEALRSAGTIGSVQRDDAARDLWAHMYEAMDLDAPGGLLEAVTCRDTAQVLRLSVTYALLDGSGVITTDHLWAAWAVWRYCRQSAAVIWGDAIGDPIADRVLTCVREAVGGVDRTEISRALSNKVSANQLDAAIEKLLSRQLVEHFIEKTGGRDRHVYVAKKAKQAKEGRAA